MVEGRGRVELLLAMTDDAFGKSDEHSIKSSLWQITGPELHYTPVPAQSEGDRQSGERSVIPVGGRVMHVALCKVMYENHAFGDRALDWTRARTAVGLPHPIDEPAPLIAALDCAQERLRSALVRLNDSDLDRMVYTNWGAQVPAWQIFNVMIQHDIWHGGQIRTLRKLWALERKRE